MIGSLVQAWGRDFWITFLRVGSPRITRSAIAQPRILRRNRPLLSSQFDCTYCCHAM